MLPWFLAGFGTIMVIVVITGVRYNIREARIKKEEDIAKAKLQEATKEGYEMAYEREEQLDRQDHRDLDRLLWRSVRLILIPIVVFCVVGYWIVYFYIPAAVFSGLIIWSFERVQRIRHDNVKTVIRGFVTDRFTVRSRSRYNRSVAPDYYIQVGERKFLVDAGMYDKFKPGEMSEIHFINRSVKIFGIATHGYVILSAMTLPYSETIIN